MCIYKNKILLILRPKSSKKELENKFGLFLSFGPCFFDRNMKIHQQLCDITILHY